MGGRREEERDLTTRFTFVCVIIRSGLIFLIEFKLLSESADHFIDGDVDYCLLDALR